MKRKCPHHVRQCPFNRRAAVYQSMQLQDRLKPKPFTTHPVAIRRRDCRQEINRHSVPHRPALAKNAGRRCVKDTIPQPPRRPALLLRGPMYGPFANAEVLGNLRSGEKYLGGPHIS